MDIVALVVVGTLILVAMIAAPWVISGLGRRIAALLAVIALVVLALVTWRFPDLSLLIGGMLMALLVSQAVPRLTSGLGRQIAALVALIALVAMVFVTWRFPDLRVLILALGIIYGVIAMTLLMEKAFSTQKEPSTLRLFLIILGTFGVAIGVFLLR